MSDLTSELRDVADAAASQARPLPAGDVVRLGDRRRRRTIAQRSIGGLSAIGVVGVTGAMILSGSPAGQVTPASASAVKGGNTVTESTVSAAGTMTVTVKYRREPHGKLQLLAMRFSGATKAAVPDPLLTIAVTRPARRGQRSGEFILIPLGHGRSKKFSGAVSLKDIVATRQRGGMIDGETLVISLAGAGRTKSGRPVALAVNPVLQLGMILTPAVP